MIPSDEQAQKRAEEIVGDVIDRHALYTYDENSEDHQKVRHIMVGCIKELLLADHDEAAVPIDQVMGGMVWGLQLAYCTDDFHPKETDVATKVIGCGVTVEVTSVPTKRDGSFIQGSCGKQYGGVEALCDDCTEWARKKYPQGWSYYPGDTCRHGNYLGGSGRDILCGPCENGE